MWVETVNQYGGSDNPIVTTSMTGVTAEQASMEERLYARSQLLSRLSDALPVGVFQVNMAGHVTFTNDRLHVIVGGSVCGPPSPTRWPPSWRRTGRSSRPP